MLAQYICTTNIEQSIDFYTNVVGLRYVPRQADQQESLRSREGGVARSCDVLLIRDETISMSTLR